jgi:hypothetical protein
MSRAPSAGEDAIKFCARNLNPEKAPSIAVLKAAFNNEFVISDFPDFQNEIKEIYEDVNAEIGGVVTDFTAHLVSVGQFRIIFNQPKLQICL